MNTRSALEFSPGAAGPVTAAGNSGDWERHAACQYIDADLWFPSMNDGTDPEASPEDQEQRQFRALHEEDLVVDAARRICIGCPVRRNCLLFALATAQAWGMWGGLSARQRAALGAPPWNIPEITAAVDADYFARQDRRYVSQDRKLARQRKRDRAREAEDRALAILAAAERAA